MLVCLSLRKTYPDSRFLNFYEIAIDFFVLLTILRRFSEIYLFVPHFFKEIELAKLSTKYVSNVVVMIICSMTQPVASQVVLITSLSTSCITMLSLYTVGTTSQKDVLQQFWSKLSTNVNKCCFKPKLLLLLKAKKQKNNVSTKKSRLGNIKRYWIR